MILSIAQARMSSTRLPGKVLMDIGGKPIIQWVVEALPEPKLVATSMDDSDAPIVSWCMANDIHVHAGPLHDVLKRFYLASHVVTEANWILRVCCDCPMLTNHLVSKFIIKAYGLGIQPYTIYTNRPYDPDGLDLELFSVEALKMAYEHATDPYDREHVGPWFYRHLNVRRFSVTGRPIGPENPDDKISIDTIQDLEKVRAIMEAR